MPRNGSGSYSLPEPPFVPNTVISSTVMNAQLDDIADGLTDSLARNGEGGMEAVLGLDNDGFAYVSDPDTGMRRSAANIQRLFGGGTDLVEFSATALDILVGTLKLAGVTVFPVPTAQIADHAVTYAKIQESAAATRILAATTAADYSEHTISQILNFIASVARGDILARGASDWDRLAIGAAGTVLSSDGTDPSWGAVPPLPTLHVREAENSGTGSQISYPGNAVWATRRINTEVTNTITGASIGSFQVTLAAGTYEVSAGLAVFRTIGSNAQSRLRLQNVTDATTALLGVNNTIGSNGAITGVQPAIQGRFTIAAQKVFELQQWTAGTTSGQSFGDAQSNGQEIYADLMIRKVG